jgi:hypothetical protein
MTAQTITGGNDWLGSWVLGLMADEVCISATSLHPSNETITDDLITVVVNISLE